MVKKIHARDGEPAICPVCGDVCAIKVVWELVEGREKEGKSRR